LKQYCSELVKELCESIAKSFFEKFKFL
jgi:hypothetical protein